MKALSGQRFTRISKKRIPPFSSNSMVNFMLFWRLLRCKNSDADFPSSDKAKVSSTHLNHTEGRFLLVLTHFSSKSHKSVC